MAFEENLILNMPFDEADGATTTYDYSTNRADGIVTDAHFESGKSGNCIRFDGNGKCEVSKSVLSFAGAFTLATFVKSHAVASKLIVLFNYNGNNRFFQSVIDVTPEKWYYLAVTREGNAITLYLNGTQIGRSTVPNDYGNPIGFSISQDCYIAEFGHGCLDELKLYKKALSQEEILGLLDNTKQLTYLLDGVDFKDFGVFVSSSKGILDALKMKEPLRLEWDGYHGEAIDLTRPRMQARDITINCFIENAGGKITFVKAVKEFLEQFFTPHKQQEGNATLVAAGLHRLTIDIHPTKALIYEVYMPDGAEIEKEWNDKKMVGTFTLKLREPEPVKRVLKHFRVNESSKTVTITLTSQKLVNIYWGDGTTTQDVYGTTTITHDYTENGEYYVVITGVIEDITSFSTNAIIVWNKL
jgi:hypothetical protein